MSEWFDATGAIDTVKIGDRGFQYGDGLFETIAIRGGQPRLWDYHMDRLSGGCKRLAIRMPARDELSQGLGNALRHSSAVDQGLAKLVLTAGDGRRGYGRAYADVPFVCYGVFEAALPPRDSYREGVVTAVCGTRLAVNPTTAGLKTLGRLEQVLARSELAATEAYEGLTMDVDGNIICGTMSNLFVVHRSELSTPSLARCGVEGVMRRHVMVTLAEQGIRAEIRTLTLAEMNESDEIFICNSQFGVLPVRRCGEHCWPVGEITRSVMAALAANGIAECRL
jgi:4-amino-4-deoxychorismate lyase